LILNTRWSLKTIKFESRKIMIRLKPIKMYLLNIDSFVDKINYSSNNKLRIEWGAERIQYINCQWELCVE
jgi:hypothetical protein